MGQVKENNLKGELKASLNAKIGQGIANICF